jgi:HAD superfamily hydrolase (TIGR01509 family)
MYKLIIFDFSKTLAYPGKTDLKGIFGRMKDYGIDVKDEKQAQQFLDRVFSLFSEVDSWTEFTDKVVEFSAVDISKEKKGELGKYLQKKLSFKLYDDAKEVFNLPQRKAILTLANRFLVEGIKELSHFDIFTEREIQFKKPDKQAFTEVLKKMKAIPGEVVMVGDSLEKDIMPAMSLGITGILIDREGKVSDNSIIKISSLKELKRYL